MVLLDRSDPRAVPPDQRNDRVSEGESYLLLLVASGRSVVPAEPVGEP